MKIKDSYFIKISLLLVVILMGSSFAVMTEGSSPGAIGSPIPTGSPTTSPTPVTYYNTPSNTKLYCMSDNDCESRYTNCDCAYGCTLKIRERNIDCARECSKEEISYTVPVCKCVDKACVDANNLPVSSPPISPTDPTLGNGCKKLYYFDNTNKNCNQKEFCGTYMYQGLYTFQTKLECENLVKNTNNLHPPGPGKPDPGKGTPNPEFCGTSTNFQCSKDAECRKAGCSGQICMGKNEEGGITTCEYKECYNNDGYNCGCIAGGCQWSRDDKTKILPEVASEKAKERLGELNFQIYYKPAGEGNNKKSIYSVEAFKEGKILGLFKAKGKVSAEIDSETGNVLKVRKPWWAIFASGI